MKNMFTLKRTIGVSLSLLFSLSLSAQEKCIFEKVGSKEVGVQDVIPGGYRTRPIVADFDNDGFLDLYYGGQDPSNGRHWDTGSNLVLNKGDYNFSALSNPVMDQVFDENGDPVLTDDGKPTYTVTYLSDEGLITRNAHSYFSVFDFNNDGNLDILVIGRKSDGMDGFPDLYCVLYKNLGKNGDFNTFEQVLDTPFPMTANEGNMDGITIGDYNKDGFLDIVIIGNLEGEQYADVKYKRFVNLYKNNGDETFTLMNIAKTKNRREPVFIFLIKFVTRYYTWIQK